jgi:hypothetical protein
MAFWPYWLRWPGCKIEKVARHIAEKKKKKKKTNERNP